MIGKGTSFWIAGLVMAFYKNQIFSVLFYWEIILDYIGEENEMSNLVTFENADNESNILRIGGKSFLPPDMEWPTNPNGEKMVFIFNIPTNFLN